MRSRALFVAAFVLVSILSPAGVRASGEQPPAHAQCVGLKLPPARRPSSDMPMP